jgi:small subunit ribosomal protein S15
MSLEGNETLAGIEKSQLIQKFRRHEKDTGSPEVQIGILTRQLEKLMKHFEGHPQDVHSKVGLFAAVAKRKKLLEYLKKEDIQRYRAALDTFGIRK